MKSLYLILFACSLSFAQKNPTFPSSETPEPIRHMEWGSYAVWGLGMGALFTGYVYDGKGSRAHDQAQFMYDQAKQGSSFLDVDKYHDLRSKVSEYRSLRNQWFGIGAGFLLSSTAMYAYSIYLDKQWKMNFTAQGAQVQMNFGGK